MTEQVQLVLPTIDLRQTYLDFYQEWIDSGEDMVPWVISKDPSDFEEMLNFLFSRENGENLPENWVADSTYWLVTDANKVVGVVNIRHSLSEKLLHSGGHVGYGIRPSERRRGYAAQLLALALEKTKQLGIEKVLVVCDENNMASERTIIRNGGLQDVSYTEEDGNVVKRFWISHHL